ncbi:MAG: hypothetical protein LBI13_04250 [Streptococcaceae bacterium]|jgi:acyl carrier protein|nr:hypothetical protein [Streptococcaceae bacterium]
MMDKLMQCFENLGIFLEDIQKFDIDKDIEDSLEFISLIVEIEEVFEINIPDEYLDRKRLRNINSIKDMIVEISNNAGGDNENS